MAAASPAPFLTAEWRQIVMLNYNVAPALLAPHLPMGTELDLWDGRVVVSLVGFLFLETRVLGIPIPFHRNFEEINLRFYVRRKAPEGWRRGVVFIKELVPRLAVAGIARAVYGENYAAVPMGHRIAQSQEDGRAVAEVCYHWRFRRKEYAIRLVAHGESRELAVGSEEEFITEHYWGYTRRAPDRTVEYQVTHPRWRVWTASEARFTGEVGPLYGPQFVEALSRPPASAFLADGSAVTVFRGVTHQE